MVEPHPGVEMGQVDVGDANHGGRVLFTGVAFDKTSLGALVVEEPNEAPVAEDLRDFPESNGVGQGFELRDLLLAGFEGLQGFGSELGCKTERTTESFREDDNTDASWAVFD